MLSDILRVGDKVDIRILQEVLKGYDLSDKMHIFKSKLHDITSEDEIIIAMPMESSKVVLLPMDIRYDLCFYSQKGLFNCTAVIKDRFKDNNLFEIVMKLTSPLQKYQRRKFYRMECLVDFGYYVIEDPRELEMKDASEAHEYHIKQYPEDAMKLGTIVDISGGGVRVITNDKMPKEADLLLFFRVNAEGTDYNFTTFARVISTGESEKLEKKYESRIEYMKMNNLDKERIVKYVFQVEREKRRNQNK